ncbi:Beta-galactosidase C-terminal domain [Streptomyces sp. NBC_01618]|uniref:Beta-galactosidase C-terminal domain n=1 Tax=Streptomyces sp. NBC_01618 TaxID=2975900 RepID=UPI00386554A5|nr:Beta-galactosidase C-terminal domain [Streptomyces sp. NBC_01618]
MSSALRSSTARSSGRPAVTRHPYGTGTAWYTSAHLGDGIAAVLDDALRAAGVRPVLDVPEGVEATVRSGARGTYLVVLDHSEHDTRTPLTGPYAAGGTDLLTGAAVRDHIDLGPLGVAVLRIATDSRGETEK